MALILSSSQTLLPELLRKIMLYTISIDDAEEMPRLGAIRRAPNNVAAVCQSWRAAALSYGLLWSTIRGHIKLDSPEDIQRFQLDVLRRYLRRSRPALLTLDIEMHSLSSQTGDNGPVFDDFLETIRRHQKRLRSLRIVVHGFGPGLMNLPTPLYLTDTPYLENLDLQFLSGHFESDCFPYKALVDMTRAPRIKQICSGYSVYIILPDDMFRHLTSVDLLIREGLPTFTSGLCLWILHLAPVLESFQALVSGEITPCPELDLCHERLSSLHLFYHKPGNESLGKIFERLTLPGLKKLAFGLQSFCAMSMAGCEAAVHCIARSVERGASITHLCFQSIGIAHVVQCLHLVPSLSTLVVNGPLGRIAEFEGEILMLRELVLRDVPSQLCPKLEVVSFTNILLPVDSVVSLTLSRWNPAIGLKYLKKMHFKNCDLLGLRDRPEFGACVNGGLLVTVNDLARKFRQPAGGNLNHGGYPPGSLFVYNDKFFGNDFGAYGKSPMNMEYMSLFQDG
ncbi:hypothetical protein DFH11DRAFT_1177123 [Phellopilus nigrolimitatus]|nr:hypothetical protein DFH11DRAFT_1177123 [Phellopilus nigrolimitatus]